MSLTERLVAARESAATPEPDRIEEVKGVVHAELLSELGPQLYDAEMDHAALGERVRAVLTEVLAQGGRTSQVRVTATSEQGETVFASLGRPVAPSGALTVSPCSVVAVTRTCHARPPWDSTSVSTATSLPVPTVDTNWVCLLYTSPNPRDS